MQVLHRHVRPQVANGSAAFVSAMPSDQQLPLSIVLPLRNQAALKSLLGRLYDPTSPDYRHFLTVSQFTDQFGPTAEDYQAVRAFTQSNGLTITGDPANRLVVSVTGSVAQISAAFNVKMNVYQHPSEKRTFFSLDREPSLQLGVPVAHISGLDSFSLPHHMSERPKNAGANDAQPQAISVTGSGPGGSYLGSDMRAAYYGGTQLDGNGQAIGLVEFGGYSLSDVNNTFANAGQTYIVPVNNVLLDGSTGASVGADAEEVLDIVQAIGMAPNLSQVRVYIGSGNDNANVLNSMASENIAKQLSCSWGWIPADPTVDDVFFQEMAAQGQTFFTASGDDGAYDSAINPYFYPADDQFVTAVGGTHLTTNGIAGTWSGETVWNSQSDGSGGGISPDGITIPGWQVGLANSANGGSNTFRNVPDLAMEGDFDNYNCSLGVCAGNWAGTSFATPRWAGFMALVNQQAVEAGNAPMGGLGFINTTIYQIAQGANAANDLHDITSGNNDTRNQPTWFSAVPGYDLTTGWGSANGQSLIDDLAGKQVPGFWIASSQSTVGINPGNSGKTILTITDAGDFTGSVDLVVSGLPTGVTASLSPASTSGTSVLTLTASSSLTTQSGTITIIGTAGTLTASTTLTVSVHTPSFVLAASPASLGINQGASGTSTISVTPQYGFSDSVTLAASGLPSGVTASFSTNPATGSSVVTFTASSTATAGVSSVTITGTSGSITASATIALTIHGPSFTLSGGGTASIGQGSSGYAYIYVEDLYGFNGSVNLTVSGLPTGVTASFSPNPTTGSSTLTFTASSTAVVGQSTITITGTSGALTAITTVTLGVFAPTFTLSSSGTINVGTGTSANGSVYVYDEYGFNGNVTLSVAGLPSGVTAVWSPNPTTGSSSLSLTASSSAKTGQYPLTVTGVSGSQTATTTFTLGVYTPTFTLETYNVTMGQGTTASSQVYVEPEYGFTGSVNLAVSGLPSGVTATFTPNPTTGYSALSLQASSNATLGQYTVTVTGTSGTRTVTNTFTLGVYTPTFTLYGNNSVSLGQGSSTTSYMDISPQYGFNGSVNLSIGGLPSGVTASFSPNPTTGYSTLTLQATSAAALGQYTLTVTGTSGGQTATTTVTLTVYTPTFTLSSGGSVTVGRGTSTTSYVYVYPQYGFTGSVAFSIAGLPSGVTASFSPNPASSSSTLVFTASSAAVLGQYTVTITGTSGSQSATTSLTLGVFAPTFTLTSYSSVSIGQGSTSSAYLYVTPQYGFPGAVNLAVSGLPNGVTASFSPNPTTGSSVLTLTASSSAAIGSGNLTVSGTYGSQTVATTIPLSVFAPSFTIYSSLYNVSLNENTSTTSGYVSITPQYGFTGSVNLSATGLPSGVTATFSPNPTTSSTNLILSASSTATPGTVTVTLVGTSGSTTASTSFTLTISAPSFTVTDAPSAISLLPGGSDRSILSIVPQFGFSGNVTYAATGLPSGVTAAFSPNPTTGVSTLTLTASSTATPGNSPITITGTSGLLNASVPLALTISPARNTTATTLTLSAGGSPITSIAAGTVLTATASVSSGSNQLTIGEVYFCLATAVRCDSTHRVGSAQLTAAGTATLRFLPAAGTPGYIAIFAGTNSNAASNSATSSLTVTGPQSSTTAMTASGTAGNYTLTATVSGKGPSAPLGNVSFLDTTNSNAVLSQSALGNSTSTFSASLTQSPVTGLNPYNSVRGDFNEDGISDLAVAASGGGVTMLFGNGDGTFKAGAAVLASGIGARFLVLGDFDRDGHADLAVLPGNANAVLIFLGNGDGTFTQASSSPPTGNSAAAISVGDFNGDGLQDLVTINAGSNTLSVLLGNGDGTFSVANQTTPTGSEAYGLAVADFNGDGVQDLLVTYQYSSALTVFLGNGDGSFSPVTTTLSSLTPLVKVADFNQDGRPDLVIVSEDEPTVILLGNGDGTFTAAPSLPSIANAFGVAVADFNQDGFPDFAVTNEYANTVAILIGQGDGTFKAGGTLTTGSEPVSIVIGDWNGDGIPDLATANYAGNTLSVFSSQLLQTATATASNVSPVGPGQHAVEASFPGNAAFAPGFSATALLTGGPATPTVTLTFSLANVTTTKTLTVTVAVGDGAGNPIPTGSIVLSGGGYTSASTALSSGSVAIVVPAGALASGADTLFATYMPDANSSATYKTASGSGSVTVARATPTVTVSPGASNLTVLQTLAVNITVSGGSGAATPSGSVTLSTGSYTSAAATLNGGGSVNVNIPAGTLAAGMDSLTASYMPDSSSSSTYNGASGASTVTVSKTTPAVTLSLSSGSITTAQSLTVTIGVNAGSGNNLPTGTVTLTSGNYSSVATTLSGGNATIVVPAGALVAGTDSLSIGYVPDGNGSSLFNPASGLGSVNVGRITPTVTVSPAAAAITLAQSLTVNVTVNGGGGNPNPTGTVSLSGGGYSSAAITLAGGSASMIIPANALALGIDTLTVNYITDVNSSGVYGSATGSGSVTVGKLTPSVTITPSTTAPMTTQPVTVTIAVGGGSGNPVPTGTMTLAGGKYSSAGYQLSNGSASITIPSDTLTAGTDTLTATYLPDASSAPTYLSATGTGSVSVAAAAPSLSLSLSSSTITTIQPVTVTAVVNPGSGNPAATGSLALTSGSYSSASVLVANGAATITVPAGLLAAGTDSLTVSYTPDANSSSIYTSGTGTGSVVVSKATPTFTLNLSSASITTNQPLMVTVAVGGGSGTATATGTVSLGGAGATTQQTLQNGSATFIVAAGSLAAGSDTLLATYTPDAASLYATATQSASVTVTAAFSAAVTVSASASAITYQQGETVSHRGCGGRRQGNADRDRYADQRLLQLATDTFRRHRELRDRCGRSKQRHGYTDSRLLGRRHLHLGQRYRDDYGLPRRHECAIHHRDYAGFERHRQSYVYCIGKLRRVAKPDLRAGLLTVGRAKPPYLQHQSRQRHSDCGWQRQRDVYRKHDRSDGGG